MKLKVSKAEKAWNVIVGPLDVRKPFKKSDFVIGEYYFFNINIDTIDGEEILHLEIGEKLRGPGVGCGSLKIEEDAIIFFGYYSALEKPEILKQLKQALGPVRLGC